MYELVPRIISHPSQMGRVTHLPVSSYIRVDLASKQDIEDRVLLGEEATVAMRHAYICQQSLSITTIKGIE
jgi:hypothetical protein